MPSQRRVAQIDAQTGLCLGAVSASRLQPATEDGQPDQLQTFAHKR